MSIQIRKYFLKLHRWTALSIGLVVILSAFTGLSLIFREQLEPKVNPDLLTVSSCTDFKSLDSFIKSAQLAKPEYSVDYIRLTRETSVENKIPSVIIRYTNQNFVYLNPCSGEILGFRHRYGGLFGSIDQIHRWRFMKNGSLVVGTSAILFALILIVGGFFLTFSANGRSVKDLFMLRKGLIGLPRLVNIHKIIGIYVGLILLLSVATGLPQAFDWYKKGIYTITGSEMHSGPKKVIPVENGKTSSIEEIWVKAKTFVPNPKDALIHIPSKEDEVVEIFMIPENAPHIHARSYLYINPYGNQVLKFSPYEESSIGFKIYFWSLSWHTARFGGLTGQLILLTGALGLILLAFTGFASYFKKTIFRTAN